MAGSKRAFVEMVNFFIYELSAAEKWPEGVLYWETKVNKDVNNSVTENGRRIIECMKTLETKESSKYIADILGIPSRSVAGALVKLVNDGFVNKEKCEDAPALYYLTELGKNI